MGNDGTEHIRRLKQQISRIKDVQAAGRASPEFKKWRRDNEVVIERIFGEGTRHTMDFKKIQYSPGVITCNTPPEEYERRFQKGLQEAGLILQSFIEEIQEYGIQGGPVTSISRPAEVVERICKRFFLVTKQLQRRREDRQVFEINDEYDVQDLMRALLTLHFDDVRPEEWTPSFAGAASRMDFLLKQERILIEVKKTREGLSDKRLGDELIVDISRYQAHPDCETLICLIYDPESRISNPKGMESDLSGLRGRLKVRVIVSPNGL